MALSGELVKFVGGELAKNAGKSAATSALSSIAPKAITSAVASAIPKAATSSVLSGLVPATTQAATEVPTKLYRGQLYSNTDFSFNSPSMNSGDSYGSQALGPAYHFTPDKEAAKSWADANGGGVIDIEYTPNQLLRAEDARRMIDESAKTLNDSKYMQNLWQTNPELAEQTELIGMGNLEALAKRENKPFVEHLADNDNELGTIYYYKDIDPELSNKFVQHFKEAKANDLNEFTQAAIKANVDPETAGRAMDFLPRNKAVENPGVLMENGKPMKLYHSTPNQFDKFDDSYIGKNTMYDSAKLGHFATPDYDFSSRFADIDNTGKPGYTMEVQIQSKKPITHPYGAGIKYGPVDVDNIVRAYYHELGLDDVVDELAESAAENGTSLYDEYMDLTFGGENPFEVAETERQALMDKGYDSLELVEGRKKDLVEGSQDTNPVSSYVAFEGKNINKVKHLPVEKSGEGTDIAVHRGDVSQQIAADPQLKRLRQSPARDMLGQEQLDAYKRALNGEVLDDDFLKNDSFAQTLDQESNSRPYLITEDQEKGRAPIPEQQLQEFRDISRKFIDSNLKGVEKGRKAVVVLGRPSSGKSSGAVNLYSSKKGKGFFELDNDEIKKLLPGYDDGMGANAVHPASSYISNNMVLPELANEGYNIVLPIVGKKEAAVEKYLNALYDRGYEISMINTNLPLDKCRTRNRTRAYETGRNVADGYLVSVGENPDMVYNKYKENIIKGTERRINGFAEVSTDVPFGSKARVIENSGSELLARLGLGPNKK